jgi:translation initiation factor IF-1
LGADETVEPVAGGRMPVAGGRLVAAEVLEERPSAIYVVLLEEQQRVLAHIVGAVKRNFVRLVPGDRVEVELAPQDPTRGRITRKL